MAALEQVFELDAAFNDGQLSVYRSGRPIDELMGGMRESFRDAAEGNTVSDTEELRERIKTLRQSDRDIADGRTSTLEEVREELDGNETGDAPDVNAQVDAAVDSFEKKVEKLDEDSADEESETQADDDRPTCQYCGDTFDPRGLKRHEQRCDENPDNIADNSEDEENADEVMCEHCGDSFPRRGLGPHQRFCEDNPANTDDESEDDDTQENTSDGDTSADENENSVESDRADDGGLVAKKPAAIRKAMQNPDDLPEDPVPVGVAIQYNAGSYTCKSCDTCLNSDKELTEHVNAEGHRGAFQVNRRRCK